MKLKTVAIAVMFLLICSGYTQTSELSRSVSPENFVMTLYREYISEYDKEYWFDNKQKLAIYFDNKLVESFMADEKCKEKSQEICNLDFDPVIDAQDLDNKYPVRYKVTKQVVNGKIRCLVVFENITKRTIIYEIKPKNGDWRITDIKYPDGRSLYRLLNGYVYKNMQNQK